MIESLLPAELRQTREKIRELATHHKGSRGSILSLAGLVSESERENQGAFLQSLKHLTESFDSGDRKWAELMWLVEELAAVFPQTALEAAVSWALIGPVLSKAGLDRTRCESQNGGWASVENSAVTCNHLFLPPPARKALRLMGRGIAAVGRAEDARGQYFPAFDFSAGQRILIPALAQPEGRAETLVLYYLVQDEGLRLEPCPAGKGVFPFRPASYWMEARTISASRLEPILKLTADQFQAGLETYFLLLSAVFSGWARAGWQGLVRKKQSGDFSPGLDAEISFLVTEIGRLQLGLFHLSRSRSFPGECYSARVEKLCLKGLHLASRAWRHFTSREH
ncbi:MAG: hypothetical protein N3G18_00100 [Candidatus Saccharicenans sp.]|nr:hypothetical protein [Candidatus Saccharicenans sp.]